MSVLAAFNETSNSSPPVDDSTTDQVDPSRRDPITDHAINTMSHVQRASLGSLKPIAKAAKARGFDISKFFGSINALRKMNIDVEHIKNLVSIGVKDTSFVGITQELDPKMLLRSGIMQINFGNTVANSILKTLPFVESPSNDELADDLGPKIATFKLNGSLYETIVDGTGKVAPHIVCALFQALTQEERAEYGFPECNFTDIFAVNKSAAVDALKVVKSKSHEGAWEFTTHEPLYQRVVIDYEKMHPRYVPDPEEYLNYCRYGHAVGQVYLKSKMVKEPGFKEFLDYYVTKCNNLSDKLYVKRARQYNQAFQPDFSLLPEDNKSIRPVADMVDKDSKNNPIDHNLHSWAFVEPQVGSQKFSLQTCQDTITDNNFKRGARMKIGKSMMSVFPPEFDSTALKVAHICRNVDFSNVKVAIVIGGGHGKSAAALARLMQLKNKSEVNRTMIIVDNKYVLSNYRRQIEDSKFVVQYVQGYINTRSVLADVKDRINNAHYFVFSDAAIGNQDLKGTGWGDTTIKENNVPAKFSSSVGSILPNANEWIYQTRKGQDMNCHSLNSATRDLLSHEKASGCVKVILHGDLKREFVLDSRFTNYDKSELNIEQFAKADLDGWAKLVSEHRCSAIRPLRAHQPELYLRKKHGKTKDMLPKAVTGLAMYCFLFPHAVANIARETLSEYSDFGRLVRATQQKRLKDLVSQFGPAIGSGYKTFSPSQIIGILSKTPETETDYGVMGDDAEVPEALAIAPTPIMCD